MKILTNIELLNIQGGSLVKNVYNVLFKRIIKHISKNLKILAN